MSYILDALKKAERERRRGAVPGVTTAQDIPAREQERRLFWPYVLVGALILNAGILVWWFTWPQEKTPAAKQSAATEQRAAKTADLPMSQPAVENPNTLPGKSAPVPGTASAPDAPAAGTDLSRSATTPQPGPENAKTDARKDAGNKPEPAAKQKNLRQGSPATPQQAAPAKSPEADPRASVPPAPDKNRLYSLRELPASVQQGLPDFTISTHLYSGDAASRLVRINGRPLKEDQPLASGLVLEAITPYGVIFSYQDYRFRVEIK